MRFHFFPRSLCLVPALVACQSLRSQEVVERSVDELANLKDTLAASHFQPCEIHQGAMPLPVPIRSAKVQWHEGAPILVYEGIFREAVKSVWQPLANDYAPQGDGVVIGQKEMPFVADFATASDELGGFWTTYRFKVPRSEIFASAVEYLAKDKAVDAPIVRLGMPQSRDASAQRIWLIPLPQPSSPQAQRAAQKGIAHVIVKTVSLSGATDDDPEAIYTWYLLHTTKNLVKKMGEFRDRNGIAIERFLLARDAADLVAVGLVNDSDGAYGTNPAAATRKARVVALRPFAPGQPVSTLHEDDGGTLSNLSVHSGDGATDNVQLAWVRDSDGSTRSTIQIASTRIELPGKPVAAPAAPKPPEPKKKGKKKTAPAAPPPPPPKPSLPVRNLVVSYVPSSFSFFTLPGNPTPLLSWWGGGDGGPGFVMTRINAKGGPLITHAFVAREDLGQPMGYSVPPATRPEGLLLVFARTSDNVATAGKVRLCKVPRPLLND